MPHCRGQRERRKHVDVFTMIGDVFVEGQTVSLISRVGLSPKTPRRFEVLYRMPDIGGQSQYRIRSDDGGHERVEKGANLKLVEETATSTAD